MKRTVITPTLRYRQSGAVSIVIAMILMLMLTAAATGVLKLSGSSVIDTANHEQQISGLYIAQSGLERGQSLFSAASDPALASACSNVGPSVFRSSVLW